MNSEKTFKEAAAFDRGRRSVMEEMQQNPRLFFELIFDQPEVNISPFQREVFNQMMDNRNRRTMPIVHVGRGRRYPFAIIDEAMDVPDDVYQHLKLNVKAEPADDLRMRMEGHFEPMSDGEPLNFIKHPQRTPWWKRILMWFKRPRLSDEALEPTDDFKT